MALYISPLDTFTSPPCCINSVIGISKHLVRPSTERCQLPRLTSANSGSVSEKDGESYCLCKVEFLLKKTLSCDCKFIVFVLAAVKIKTVAWPWPFIPPNQLGKTSALLQETPQNVGKQWPNRQKL